MSAVSMTSLPFVRITVVALASCFLVNAAAHAVTERVVHRFKGGADGALPAADLLQFEGTIYGTAQAGGGGPCVFEGKGPHGCGIVFAVTADGTETILHAFQSGADGAWPRGGIINVDGTFYGTTYEGGANGQGTVFSLTPLGVETVLYSFKGGDDGAGPTGNLIDVGGTLYGTTALGGTAGFGTVFSVSTAGVETVLHSFAWNGDGAIPVAGLVDVAGTLYGVTYTGGSGGACGASCGTVYSITTDGSEAVLHSFEGGADGAFPEGQARLLDVNGTLYGTTIFGGSSSLGVVFSVDTDGSESVLYSFTESSVSDNEPQAGLTEMDKVLYGTTAGTAYSLSLNGTENMLHAFRGGRDGYVPSAGLTKMKGKLYGVTIFGGGKGCRHDGGCGTVFSIRP